jgi:hypothetical protein
MLDIYIVDNSILDSIDLSHLWPYAHSSQFQYFNLNSGNEHYKLLASLSYQFPNNSTIIDIGTSTGHSALALSINPNIKVITYNIGDEVPSIENQMSIKNKNNIEIRIKNCIKDIDILLNAPFILLDTFHDGSFERELIQVLLCHNYKGIVMCDDIKLNKEMVDFWNWVPLKKIDVSNYGHWSGTGMILFDESSVNITVIKKQPIPTPPIIY